MSKNPRRFAEPVRLIVSVEIEVVAAIDRLMTQGRHHGHRNRAEFVWQNTEIIVLIQTHMKAPPCSEIRHILFWSGSEFHEPTVLG